MSKDGGPAFPYQLAHESGATHVMQGMSLRDYFAAAALPAMAKYSITSDRPSTMAKLSYEVADAMLAERERKRV